MRAINRWNLRGAFAALGVVLTAAPTVAQNQGRVTAPWPSAAALVASFEAEFSRVPAGRPGGVGVVLSEPERFAAAKVDSVLAGLERLAITSQNANVRRMAAVWLSTPGEISRSRPFPGVASRLADTYRGATDSRVHYIVIAAASRQAEGERAAEFLRAVAVSDRAPYRGAQADAVAALDRLGNAGRGVLRDLYQRKLVHDPDARAEVERIAANAGW